MAEAAVAIVINKAIAAKALLEGEEHHLRENISWIETQMETLQSYLKDAQSKGAANFINSIRDFALDAEDSLDNCLLAIESHRSKGSFGFLRYSSCMPCYGFTDGDISRKIGEFKRRAAQIEGSRGVIAADSDVDRKFWEKTRKFKRKMIFGRKETGQIEEKITGGDEKCRIISITGPGGVGKTTVAREIYHRLKSEFECSAMVYISGESRMGEILIDIARQVELEESEMRQNLPENLHLYLCKKKYVIFIDDFSDKWEVLRDIVMTNSRNGSRIIITCREPEFEKLAFHFDALSRKVLMDDSITLEHLSGSEGEELFYDSMEGTLSPELKNIGDKIVRKCGGLPLAIHVAAGLLKAKERSERSWNDVLERMNESGENESFKMILDLSYQDLPTKLKPFFLYFGIFPMNREIFVAELIQLWVAEKLVIQAGETRKPDEIVDDYIHELIERNLIQVSRTRFDGRVKSCGIQNLLHDLCTRKAEGIKFFCNWNNLGNADLASTVRRVITDSSSTSSAYPGKFRALLCFSKSRELARFIQNHAFELRFLQLLTIEVEYKAINIPVQIGDLSGLIYLKLKGQFITVPSRIRKLKRLQTLEVRSREVPESILKMKHLMHLFLSAVIILEPKIRERRDRLEVDLENLETLDFDYQFGYHLSPSSFKKLPSLKKLKVAVVRTLTLEAFCGPTPLLPKLEDLKLRIDCTSDIPAVVKLSGYKNLRTLNLSFDSSNSTCSFEFPNTLVKITLGGINAEDKDPSEKLKTLPSLEILKLKNCITSTLDFSGNGSFPQLKMLMLSETKFQLLVVDEKGMPNLDKFIYKAHPKQTSRVPQKLWKMRAKYDSISSSIRVIEVV